MKIIQFLKDFFGSKTEVTLQEKINTEATTLAVETYAIEMAINLISGCIAKSEFKTFVNNKPVKKDMYYLWNVQPNKNQNATEFIDKMVHKLLLENEVLIIQSDDGQLIIADSFSHDEYALVDDIFKNVTVKDYTFNRSFYMSDVIYIKLHENNITAYLDDLMSGYTELMDMSVKKYERSGGRKGIIKLDKIPSGDKDAQEKVQKLFNEDFKNYFNSENAVLPLDKGVEYTELNGEGSKKSTSEMTDIRNLLEEMFTRVAQAYRIPPSLLKGDIANVAEITDNLLTFCIDPIVNLIQTGINKGMYGKRILQGFYIMIDTTAIKHIDVFSIADKIDKLISDGIYCIDELREKIGDTILNEDWSKKHYMTKNYTGINNLDSMEGGD